MSPQEAKRRIDMIEEAGGFWAAWALYGAELLTDTPFDDLEKPINFVRQVIDDYDKFLKASRDH